VLNVGPYSPLFSGYQGALYLCLIWLGNEACHLPPWHAEGLLYHSTNVFPRAVLMFPTYGFVIIAFVYILITQMTKCSLCSKFDNWEYSAEVSVTYNRLNVDRLAQRNSADRSRLHTISLFIILKSVRA